MYPVQQVIYSVEWQESYWNDPYRERTSQCTYCNKSSTQWSDKKRNEMNHAWETLHNEPTATRNELKWPVQGKHFTMYLCNKSFTQWRDKKRNQMAQTGAKDLTMYLPQKNTQVPTATSHLPNGVTRNDMKWPKQVPDLTHNVILQWVVYPI